MLGKAGWFSGIKYFLEVWKTAKYKLSNTTVS